MHLSFLPYDSVLVSLPSAPLIHKMGFLIIGYVKLKLDFLLYPLENSCLF